LRSLANWTVRVKGYNFVSTRPQDFSITAIVGIAILVTFACSTFTHTNVLPVVFWVSARFKKSLLRASSSSLQERIERHLSIARQVESVLEGMFKNTPIVTSDLAR